MQMNMNVGIRAVQTQQQTLAQRIRSEQLLRMHVQILEALYPEGNFQPHAKCPRCSKHLEVKEILAGFRDDPQDLETSCPNCKHRFAPRLIARGAASRVELPFYCEIQTVWMLEEVQPIPFEEFRRKHPAILQSARFYFGTLTAAFRRVDVAYEGEPLPTWQDKVESFLGQCPDTMIATCVGKSASSVRRLRLKKGIKAYSSRQRKKVG